MSDVLAYCADQRSKARVNSGRIEKRALGVVVGAG
jgi:hypothetical protein